MRLPLASTARLSLGPWWVGLVTVGCAIAETVAAVVTVGQLACAPDGIEFSRSPPPDTKVALVQAVALAERRLHGRAVRASLHRHGLGWAYLIRVAANGRAFDAEVDADQGVVDGDPDAPAGAGQEAD